MSKSNQRLIAKHYELRPEGPSIAAAAGKPTPFAWLLRIPLGRLLAFAVGLVFYSGSLMTNIEGAALLLPSKEFAFVFALGLQGALVLSAFFSARYQAPEPEEESTFAERWRRKTSWERTRDVCFLASLVFSIIGCASFYNASEEREHHQRQVVNSLRSQSLILSDKISEARVLAKAKLTNRVADARNVIARVQSKEADGLYADPAIPKGMIAQQESIVGTAQEQMNRWDAFAFDAQEAMAQPKPEQGFSKLQAAYSVLGGLLGSLTKTEIGEYRMPQPPLNDVAESERSGDFLPIWRAFKVLTSPLQCVLIVGFALLLENVPVKLFEASGSLTQEPVRPTSFAEPPRPKTSDSPAGEVKLFGQTIAETGGLNVVETPAWLVASTGEHDREMAELVSRFMARYRVACQAGAANASDVADRDEALQPLWQDFEASVRASLANTNHREQARRHLEKLRIFDEFCRNVGGEPEAMKLAVLETARQLARDLGYEDPARLFDRRANDLRDGMATPEPA